jgi:hypothetical protein
MRVNEQAVSFAAFSLAKALATELMRKGILGRLEFIAAISREIEAQQSVAEPTNEDAAALLEIYCDEVQNQFDLD